MFWIGVIIFSIGVLISIIATNCEPRVIVGIILVFTGTVIFILEDHPTAIDVYQGKTTLEITYKDGVPLDSTVVFKDKKK